VRNGKLYWSSILQKTRHWYR